MFRTEINLEPSPHKISLSHDIVSMGSCFAQIIGGRLKEYKFKVLSNPFGVIYNPLSVFELFRMGLHNEMPSEDSYLVNQSVHYNYHFHSDISALTRDALEHKARLAIGQMHDRLQQAHWAMITLGTAYVYKRTDSFDIVANCHKVQGGFFKREMLEPPDIVSAFESMRDEFMTVNPRIRFIFTVSPVRYIRDTLPGNSVSKAILRYACEKLSQKFENVDYFPSFEALIDDLRDYRFYGADMAHPNDLSERYVWEKFTGRYLDEPAKHFVDEWEKIRKALSHRPFYPELPAHQAFLRKTMDRLIELSKIVNVSEEVAYLKAQLK